jgi:hypothetical protein
MLGLQVKRISLLVFVQHCVSSLSTNMALRPGANVPLVVVPKDTLL